MIQHHKITKILLKSIRLPHQPPQDLEILYIITLINHPSPRNHRQPSATPGAENRAYWCTSVASDALQQAQRVHLLNI